MESGIPIITPKIRFKGEILFIDEAQIYVKAGNGGHGCVSFRREKYIAKGGPDGGDGGRGGSIFLEAAPDVDTLIDFASKHHWKAKNGLPGEGDQKSGLSGDELIIRVPVGTIIHDTDFDLILKDLDKPEMKVCICRGGRGGRGNKTFASSVRQTPRFATDGKIGQERNLRLELKLIADVGLVGIHQPVFERTLPATGHARRLFRAIDQAVATDCLIKWQHLGVDGAERTGMRT